MQLAVTAGRWGPIKPRDPSGAPAGGQTVILVSNTYDGPVTGFSGGPKCPAVYTGHTWVAPDAPEGNLTQTSAPGKITNFRYNMVGTAVESNDNNGHETAACLDGTTFGAPAEITPQNQANLKTSISYTTALKPQTVTEPNNAVTSIVYDGLARPSQSTSKYGAVTTYTYSNVPAWTLAVTNDRWVKTWMDSFGRTIKVEKGDHAGSSPVTKSVQETKYAACGCSALGKVWKVSRPYAPGDGVAWTTYEYDVRGRTTKVTLADGSATRYAYAGNTVTVTDAAGKWKKQVTDAFGNLVQVVEPDPGDPGNRTWATNYSYDVLDRLVQVTMPRGGATQVRTWSYDAGTQRLASKTEPETGTTSYTWNADGTLQSKTDGAGASVWFTYDSLMRVTKKTPKYASGLVDNGHITDYYYDSYPNNAGGYVQNAQGRLAGVRIGYANLAYGGVMDYLEELYSYTGSGLVTGKKLRFNHGTQQKEYGLSFGYNNEGQVTNDGGAAITYDTMGRPYTGPGAMAVTYGASDEILLIGSWTLRNNVEQRVYNSLGQLVLQKGVAWPFLTETYQFLYTYNDGANNGRIGKFKDLQTGEEVNYTYDAVNRLTKAETTGPEWGESMTYDGFGNLTAETPTKGTAPSYNLMVDANTNRVLNAGFAYDAAGNMTSNPLQAGIMYYPEHRMKQVGAMASLKYRYGADGQRLMKGQLTMNDGSANGPQFILPSNSDAWLYYRDPWGRLRARIRYRDVPGGSPQWVVEKSWEWFLGAPVEVGSGKWIGRDRLGSVRAVYENGVVTTRMSYFPYGQERGTRTADDTWKFATYWRDADGVLDDAQQRWYASGWGRFTTADPYQGSGGVGEPGSWNRYGYVGGDPVNFGDPRGMFGVRSDIAGACVSLSAGDTWAELECLEGQAGSVGDAGRTRWYPEPWYMDRTLGSDGGYIFNFQSAGAATAAAGLCVAQPEACVILAGGAGAVFTIYVTAQYGGALWNAIQRAVRGSRDPAQVRNLPLDVAGTKDPDGNCEPPPPDQRGPAGKTFKWQQRSSAPGADPNAPPHWHYTNWNFNLVDCTWHFNGRPESVNDPGPGYILIPGIF